MSEQIPYLCGGTFFVLLNQVMREDRGQRRRTQNGIEANFSRKKLITDAIRLFKSKFEISQTERPSAATQYSEYYACNMDAGVYLPFDDSLLIHNYDNKIRENFAEALTEMKSYATTYLVSEDCEKMRWLGQALLTLLREDVQIDKEQTLFYREGGITKTDLLSLSVFIFQHCCLLVGILFL